MISGSEMRRLRERRSWSQRDFAEVLNAALGRSYGSGSISPWENGKREIPPDVSAFVEELMIDTALPPEPVEAPTSPQEPAGDVDSAPGPGRQAEGPAAGQPAVGGPNAWTRACTELWEMIATGVGMAGAATGNDALMLDGAIIAADKEALGAAWGKLAETNETFRKMLVGMTEGGAWLQVALVTGTTVSKCYQNHSSLQLAAMAGSNGYAPDVPAAA